MGRKSSLTPDQWVEAERRHLVDGVSLNSLAIEYGVNESTLRRKIKPNKAEQENTPKPLILLAKEKAEVDRSAKRIAEEIAALPIPRQNIVQTLAARLSNVSMHMLSAAEYGAATSHRLAALANAEVSKVDDANPMLSLDTLKGVAALTEMANKAGEPALKLISATKDTIKMPTDDEDLKMVELTDDELHSIATGGA